jgi:hypothetical protein
VAVQLRAQLEQFDAKVTVRTMWRNIFQWLLAFCSWAAYISVRLFHLATGRTAKLMSYPQANTAYSILILITEIVLGLMNLVCNMRFRKQEAKFSKRNKEPATQQDGHVRSHSRAFHICLDHAHATWRGSFRHMPCSLLHGTPV